MRKNYVIIALMLLCISAIQLSAQEIGAAEEAMNKLLPDLKTYGGWQMTETPRYYKAEPSDPSLLDPILKSPDAAKLPSLWEYIDGAADIYYTYGFVLLQLNRYQMQDKPDAEITVEIYMMKDPLNAFGIYSAEKKGIDQFIEIPIEGYYVKDSLVFWHGRYYIKMSLYGIEDAEGMLLKKMAAEISTKISDNTPAPAVFALFPVLTGAKENFVYVPSEMLGIGIIGDGFTTDVTYNNSSYKIFVKNLASNDQAEELFSKIESFLVKNGKNEPLPEGWNPQTTRIISGSRIGDIILLHSGKIIAGVTEFDNISGALELAMMLLVNIK